MSERIVVLDGYTLNPGDITWEPLEALGDLTVHDRTPAHLIEERARDTPILFTNKTPTDAYRGAGRPESAYFVERAMDMLARELQGTVFYSEEELAKGMTSHVLARFPT